MKPTTVNHGILREKIDELVARYCPDRLSRIADLGCGNGILLTELSGKHPQAEAHGFDPDAQAIQNARNLAKEKGLQKLRFHHEPAEKAVAHGPFDLVLSNLALCYAQPQEAFVQGLRKALAADGTAIVCDFCLPEGLDARTMAAWNSFLKEAILLPNSTRTPRAWQELWEQSGLEVLHTQAEPTPFARTRPTEEQAYWGPKLARWEKVFETAFHGLPKPPAAFPTAVWVLRAKA
ncbi:class I SAM-dependent methyltransferase [bacterium]|nr:class I SAM-dependent methyltransferase [bacterium]